MSNKLCGTVAARREFHDLLLVAGVSSKRYFGCVLSSTYLPKGKYVCFACRSAEKVQRNKHVETHYRTPIRSIAHSRKGTFAPLSMAAMSVAPISRHTRSFGARCYSTDVEVADTFCFKMITRVYGGQTNKHDTLIAERDWSFILSTHPRLPSRKKMPGS